VRRSVSITETEALRLHVIDTVASSLPLLLEMLDGRSVETSTGRHVLTLKNATVVSLERSFQEKLLGILTDPNIAYIFMMLGLYGLLFELYNPGAILPGIIGVISLVIAFYSLHTLPVNYAGVALIVFAVILFIVDLKAPTHGFLTAGGILSLVGGSLMLFRHETNFDVISVSWQVILIIVLLTTAFFTFAIGAGIRAQKRKPATGIQGLIGERGIAISDLSPQGEVKIHGEIWRAVAAEGTIAEGAAVTVLSVDHLTLRVTHI
jgi:membrane-bound serine protease (ClpP class)